MQKLWKKKQKQAERERQNKAKSERLAKLRDGKPKGFRQIHLGTDVYLWRYFGMRVEIRTPQNQKMLVPIWIIQGLPDQAAWDKEHEECYDECNAYWVQPSMVRDYLSAVVKR
jgi:hypothetical protein